MTDASTFSDRLHVNGLGATPTDLPNVNLLSDLWTDRRRRVVLPLDERRSGSERRQQSAAGVARDRRSSASSETGRRRSEQLQRRLLMVGDALVMVVAGCLAVLFEILVNPGLHLADFDLWWQSHHSQGANRAFLHILMSLATVVVFYFQRHYVQRRPFWDELPSIAKVILAIACIESAVVLLADLPMSRHSYLATWLAALILVPTSRRSIKWMMVRMGGWTRPTVIIGCTERGRDIARALTADPLLGYYVAAFLAPRGTEGPRSRSGSDLQYVAVEGARIPVYRFEGQVDAELIRLGRPHVILALDANELDRWSQILMRKRNLFSSLSIVPSLKGLPSVDVAVAHFFRHDVMLMTVPNNLGRAAAQRIKRLFDATVAAVAVVVMLPVLAWIYLSVARDGGPPIYSQLRVGRNGRAFRCWKFRTMAPNADEVLRQVLEQRPELLQEWTESRKLRNDPRVTTVGQFLRETSLDELPQFWNVITGDMSLVGPRPVIDAEIERYGEDASYYLQTRPGITGLWQISGRSNTSYERRVALDVWYAKNWSLWYDIVILVKTVSVVLSRRGAH